MGQTYIKKGSSCINVFYHKIIDKRMLPELSQLSLVPEPSNHSLWKRLVMKPGKHQRSKQRCRDLCRKVHDPAQSFSFSRFICCNLVSKDALSKKPSQNNTLINQPRVSDHFTPPAHSMYNIELVPLELVTSNRDAIRKPREAFLISEGKTLEAFGLNRPDEI